MAVSSSSQAKRDQVAPRLRPRSNRCSNSGDPGNKSSKVDGESSSGSSTPIPTDAPPSVRATKSVRQEIRSLQKRRLFPSIGYEPRLSYFDKNSEHQDFRGFFVLFWIGQAIMVITTMLRNLTEHGYPLKLRQWDVFTADIWELVICEVLMTVSTFANIPLQHIYRDSSGWMRSDAGGVWFQSAFQASWLVFWCTLPFWRNWQWTAQVFFSLHMLTLFMKMHSYAFYNVHLANTQTRLNSLDVLPADKLLNHESPVGYPAASTDPRPVDEDTSDEDDPTGLTAPVKGIRNDLARELVSPFGSVTYPQNLTVFNYVDFLCCPTLCYELEYPRTTEQSYMELFYKSLALVGCIFLLIIIVEEYILPVLDTAETRLQNRHGWQDGLLIFAETVSSLLYPFIFVFLLVFIAIFEYLCGAFAEITRFADRRFYADWWNFSSDWIKFSQEWNVPVHHFLRRHVYGSSRAAGLSKTLATVLTFLISSLAHELIMVCITRKPRGYAFFAMMLQMPFVLFQRSPWIRNRKLLNNVLFWCSIILGLSMMCTAYVNF